MKYTNQHCYRIITNAIHSEVSACILQPQKLYFNTVDLSAEEHRLNVCRLQKKLRKGFILLYRHYVINTII